MRSPAVAIPRASRAAARLGPIPAIAATGLSIRSAPISDPSPVILPERLGEDSGLIALSRSMVILQRAHLEGFMLQREDSLDRRLRPRHRCEIRQPKVPAGGPVPERNPSAA